MLQKTSLAAVRFFWRHLGNHGQQLGQRSLHHCPPVRVAHDLQPMSCIDRSRITMCSWSATKLATSAHDDMSVYPVTLLCGQEPAVLLHQAPRVSLGAFPCHLAPPPDGAGWSPACLADVPGSSRGRTMMVSPCSQAQNRLGANDLCTSLAICCMYPKAAAASPANHSPWLGWVPAVSGSQPMCTDMVMCFAGMQCTAVFSYLAPGCTSGPTAVAGRCCCSTITCIHLGTASQSIDPVFQATHAWWWWGLELLFCPRLGQ